MVLPNHLSVACQRLYRRHASVLFRLFLGAVSTTSVYASGDGCRGRDPRQGFRSPGFVRSTYSVHSSVSVKLMSCRGRLPYFFVKYSLAQSLLRSSFFQSWFLFRQFLLGWVSSIWSLCLRCLSFWVTWFYRCSINMLVGRYSGYLLFSVVLMVPSFWRSLVQSSLWFWMFVSCSPDFRCYVYPRSSMTFNSVTFTAACLVEF